MPLTTLKSIVTFTAVAPGATVRAPHGLWVGERAVRPDELKVDRAILNGYQLTADELEVVFTNTAQVPVTVDILCERWHTIERAFGGSGTTDLNPQPFVSNGVSAPPSVAALLGVTKAIPLNTPTPLLTVDLAAIDYSWGGRLLFTLEGTNGTELQNRTGMVDLNAVLKLPATFVDSNDANSTEASTQGALTATFSWSRVGSVATFNVSVNSTLALTTLEITYLMVYASHPGFVYVT